MQITEHPSLSTGTHGLHYPSRLHHPYHTVDAADNSADEPRTVQSCSTSEDDVFWPASKEMIDEPPGHIDLPLVQDLYNVLSTKHEYPGSRAFHATNPPNSTTVVIGCRPARSHILICGIHVPQADACTAAANVLRTTDTSCFRELWSRQLEVTTIYRNIEQLV